MLAPYAFSRSIVNMAIPYLFLPVDSFSLYRKTSEIAIINKTQLTQSFGIGAYLEWEYKDNTNNWVTLLSSDPRIDDNGFTIHLSAANVYNKANFRCKLVV